MRARWKSHWTSLSDSENGLRTKWNLRSFGEMKVLETERLIVQL
jgi:hypothetical protein